MILTFISALNGELILNKEPPETIKINGDERDCMITDLKQLISSHYQYDIPYYKIDLLYNGELLVYYKFLKDTYNIRTDSTIHVVLRDNEECGRGWRVKVKYRYDSGEPYPYGILTDLYIDYLWKTEMLKRIIGHYSARPVKGIKFMNMSLKEVYFNDDDVVYDKILTMGFINRIIVIM